MQVLHEILDTENLNGILQDSYYLTKPTITTNSHLISSTRKRSFSVPRLVVGKGKLWPNCEPFNTFYWAAQNFMLWVAWYVRATFLCRMAGLKHRLL